MTLVPRSGRMRGVLLVIAVAAMAGACRGHDSFRPKPETVWESGTVSFRYTGSVGSRTIGGVYEATGSLPQPLGAHTSWAASSRSSTQVYISGYRANADGTSDEVQISYPGSATGTIDICPAVTCSSVRFTMGWTNSTMLSSSDHSCRLMSGTVTLATITAARATGTFSGTAECFSWESFDVTGSATVTEGSFTVPITPL